MSQHAPCAPPHPRKRWSWATATATATVLVLGLGLGACSTTSGPSGDDGTASGSHPATSTGGTTTSPATAPQERATAEAKAKADAKAKAQAKAKAELKAQADAKAKAQAQAKAKLKAKAVAASGTALAMLATLPVKGRAPMTGYDRTQYGPAWADVDHNGCDTRNDILARDLTHLTYKPDTHDCVIATGNLADPYTGLSMNFVRGPESIKVQIDHVVALGDTWQTGAQQLSAGTREALANDPLELLAVNGPANESKGDGDAATWLPPNKPFRCQYVARQVAVKHKYHLWVTSAERDAIARILATCPTQRVPSGATAPIVVVTGKEATSGAGSRAKTAPATKPAPKTGGKHPSVTSPISKTSCPAWAPIKGNESSMIYHLPGDEYYSRTDPEVCFSTPSAAVADGYRASQR